MTREERETLEQRICNFYDDFAKKSVKTILKNKLFHKVQHIMY